MLMSCTVYFSYKLCDLISVSKYYFGIIFQEYEVLIQKVLILKEWEGLLTIFLYVVVELLYRVRKQI